MKPKKRDERFWVRLSANEKFVLRKLAEVRDEPASQTIRRMIRNAAAEEDIGATRRA